MLILEKEICVKKINVEEKFVHFLHGADPDKIDQKLDILGISDLRIKGKDQSLHVCVNSNFLNQKETLDAISVILKSHYTNDGLVMINSGFLKTLELSYNFKSKKFELYYDKMKYRESLSLESLVKNVNQL